MNWYGSGRKRLRPNQSFPGNFLEGLRKHKKSVSQDNWCTSQDLDVWGVTATLDCSVDGRVACNIGISQFVPQSRRLQNSGWQGHSLMGNQGLREPCSSKIKFPIPSPKTQINVYKNMVKNK